MNATAWKNCCATNGMSSFARDGMFSNACLISTLPPEFFRSVDNAFELIGKISSSLYRIGGCDYTIPAQDAEAFLRNSAVLKKRQTSCQTGIVPGNVRALLPEPAAQAVSAALKFFDRQLPGFIRNGKIVGVEPCVSSPLRFVRFENLMSGMPNLWLAGEGAGAAGGIMSAACDGIRCAIAMLNHVH